MSSNGREEWTVRRQVRADDRERVREIVTATGFFNAEEIEIAVELVDERLAKGEASGYVFLFGELDGRTVAYACFGRIPLTASSYDLYWIAVDPAEQSRGLGRRLLSASEAAIAAANGTLIWVETSTRPQYQPTRSFYERCGYELAAQLADFYATGDGKAIFVKALGRDATPSQSPHRPATR